MTQTVTPVLHPQLLSEIARFFGGLDVTFKELLQNSSRAGATHAAFELPSSKTLVLTDDGCGLSDPAVLLEAGRSNFDPALDPAGLGVFSTLIHAVKSVRFESQDWSVTLTPELLESPLVPCAVPVERSSLPLERGMRVTLNLRAPLENALERLRVARGMLEMTVTLDGDPLNPHKALMPQLRAEGDFGEVLYGSSYVGSGKHRAVWEGQVLPYDLRSQLQRAATTPLASALLSSSTLWRFSRASGVRPKLPDRERLIEDAALHAALRVGLTLLEAELRVQHGAALMKLPAQFGLRQYSGARGISTGREQNGPGLPALEVPVLEALLTEQGYCKIRVQDYSQLEQRPYGNESEWVGEHSEVYFARTPLRLSSDAAVLGYHLTQKGGGVLAIRDPQATQLTLTGVRQVGAVALASDLRSGEVQLDLLVDQDADEDSENPVVTFRGDFQAALRTLEAAGDDLGGAFLYFTLCDAYRTDYGDLYEGSYISAQAGSVALRRALVEGFGDPETQASEALQGALKEGRTVLRNLERLTGLSPERETHRAQALEALGRMVASS